MKPKDGKIIIDGRTYVNLEVVTDLLCEAAQDDCENGVSSLNRHAAKNYLAEYPCTMAAISKIHSMEAE